MTSLLQIIRQIGGCQTATDLEGLFITNRQQWSRELTPADFRLIQSHGWSRAKELLSEERKAA